MYIYGCLVGHFKHWFFFVLASLYEAVFLEISAFAVISAVPVLSSSRLHSRYNTGCHCYISALTVLTASAVLYIDQKRPAAKEFDFNILPLILFFAASKPNFFLTAGF